MIHIEQFTFNLFEERCGVVWDDNGKCAIIDPGCGDKDEMERLAGLIAQKNLEVTAILLTHGHFDHIYGLKGCVEKYHVPVYMHPEDKVTLESNGILCRQFGLKEPEGPVATTDIADGDRISVGALTFEVLYTPGHTPGGVSFLEREEKVLFSGDTLFAGAIGRSDFPNGDYDSLMESIFTKIMVLDGDIDVFPGHGPNTGIANERMTNPFLMPFNMPYEEDEKPE